MDISVVPQMSNAMSQMIGLKEKGLPRIARLLQSNSSEVIRSGASLLSNMSRHPVLHKTMGKSFPCAGSQLSALWDLPSLLCKPHKET